MDFESQRAKIPFLSCLSPIGPYSDVREQEAAVKALKVKHHLSLQNSWAKIYPQLTQIIKSTTTLNLVWDTSCRVC